jgi:DNA polymerase III subunit delta'
MSDAIDSGGTTGGARWSTRGHQSALAAVTRMAAGPAPHAVLIVGPPGVGKTTLAGDAAAALLCQATDPADRPCRGCRACRLVAAGNHPDLHRLSPVGAGGQVVIGDSRDAGAARGVRDLIRDLVLLPVEGGARVAVIEGAGQMNEDAQNALLKTLEEPPSGVTVLLCVDREELLLPTVRSRCTRIRLGPVGPRDIEALLGDLGLADPAVAARLARLAEGRPGIAVAYARAPEAVTIHDEIARSLLDLLSEPRSRRLAAARELLGRAGDLAQALATSTATPAVRARRPPWRPRDETGPTPTAPPAAVESEPDAGRSGTDEAGGSDTARTTAAERRRAARQLVTIWREVARDLAIVRLGGRAGRQMVRDVALLEELAAAASAVRPDAVADFLARLDRVAESIAGNVSPELAVDVLVLAWPAASGVAA